MHYVDRNQGNTSAKKKPDQLVHDQKSEESSGSVSNQFMQDLFNMEESDKPSKSDTQKLEAFLDFSKWILLKCDIKGFPLYY